MSDLSVDFCGFLFKNPVIVSSIIYADQSEAYIIASVSAGSLDSWAGIGKIAEDCGSKDPGPEGPALVLPGFRLVEPAARREGWYG